MEQPTEDSPVVPTDHPDGPAPILAEATCHALIDLLWQLPSLPGKQVPSALEEGFRRVEREDPPVAAWLRSMGSRARPTDDGWLVQLPELLVHSSGAWLSGAAAATQCDPAAAARQRLLQVAYLTIRARATQASMQLAQQERLTAQLYNLAYGLSHELNNPLATISARAAALANSEADPARRQGLESIVENAMRGFELLGDLMLIARPPKLEPQSTDLGAFLHELVEGIQPWCAARGIEVRAALPGAGQVRLDRSALREALWAIVRNALEALSPSGCVQIQATVEEPWGIIEIRDDGPGLSPAALEQCFDPYFSGREAGRGLGLGLAKARRIVELHGGQLTLGNLPTLGCSVIVKLPTASPSDSP